MENNCNCYSVAFHAIFLTLLSEIIIIQKDIPHNLTLNLHCPLLIVVLVLFSILTRGRIEFVI